MALIEGETVIEATALHGVVRTRLAAEIDRASRSVIIELPCADPDRVLALAASQIGKPYDWAALFGFLLRRDWQESSSWFCSELPAWAFDQAGQPLYRREALRRVTPEHLWMLPDA